MRYSAFLIMFVGFCFACTPEPAPEPATPAPAKKADTAAPTADAKAAEPAAAKPVGDCTYTITDAKPGWTAFKFTEKAPVGGTFNTYKASAGATAATLTEALGGLTMEIDSASIESNNPGRNTTVANEFFAKFAPANKIGAAVVSATGDDLQGKVVIKVDMNGASKDVEFTYQVSAEGKLAANASIELLDFGLQAAFDSIHLACKDLHIGQDGVSKTWTDVALSVEASVNKTCK